MGRWGSIKNSAVSVVKQSQWGRFYRQMMNVCPRAIGWRKNSCDLDSQHEVVSTPIYVLRQTGCLSPVEDTTKHRLYQAKYAVFLRFFQSNSNRTLLM